MHSGDRQPIRLAVRAAEQILTDAGVHSPRVDAELLAAHVLGVPRTRVPLVGMIDQDVARALHTLVLRRAARVPLQHLTGTAAMGGIEVAVGPGVFIPRPETELLLVWGLDALAEVAQPRVIDLCTGSGVLALAVAHARPDAEVHAVERDPTALSWARRNVAARAELGETPVRLHHGDVADPRLLATFNDRTDLVLCNPPYVPAATRLPPEVSRHDPPQAVFAGEDGLAVIRTVVRTASRLLRPGAVVAIEHDDSQATTVPALLAGCRRLTDVVDHPDLAGRPRFSTARRC